jgi:ABC-type multidrug transport system permease subunit
VTEHFLADGTEACYEAQPSRSEVLVGRFTEWLFTTAAVVVLVVPIIAVITAATQSGVLPFTGSPALVILSVAAALIGAGALLLRPSREERAARRRAAARSRPLT